MEQKEKDHLKGILKILLNELTDHKRQLAIIARNSAGPNDTLDPDWLVKIDEFRKNIEDEINLLLDKKPS